MSARRNGEILRELRKNAGLTQKELSEKVGLADSTIRMIEIGKRDGTRSSIEKLAAFFNVTPEYLEGRENIEVKEHSNLLIDLLTMLVDKGIIKDINNIPEETEAIIINSVKQELLRIKEKKSR